MSGLDVEGVLAGHVRECADEWCAECLCGWLVPEDADDFTAAHRAHVAAAVRAEVARWLASEDEQVARALFVASGTPANWWPDHREGYERDAHAALTALAEQLAPARGDGGGS